MQKIAMPLATLILGLGLGVGAVAVAEDRPIRAANHAQSDPVLRELQNISRRLNLVNRNLGGYEYTPSRPAIQKLLVEIERNTRP